MKKTVEAKTIHEIRLGNLMLLVNEFGSQRTVAELADTSEAYLSQCIRNTDRGVGSGLARRLETGCDKPEGWMDVDHTRTKVLVSRDKREAELLAIYGKLSPDMKAALLNVARGIQKTKGK